MLQLPSLLLVAPPTSSTPPKPPSSLCYSEHEPSLSRHFSQLSAVLLLNTEPISSILLQRRADVIYFVGLDASRHKRRSSCANPFDTETVEPQSITTTK